jgi:pimeloyl-ACP methyl ester carboxylesterase
MGTVAAQDGTRLSYEEAGDGPAIVLVHGITESRHAWDPILPALSERWRVVNVDLRGHGESERRPPYDMETLASDVHALADDLGLEAPLLVGHSLGGVVVSAYGGAGYPSRGIVNVDQPIALGAFKEALEPLTPMLRGSREEFDTAIAIVFQVLDGPLPPAERERLNALSSPEPDVVLEVWSTVFDNSAEALDLLAAELVTNTEVPYLSLHGTDPGDDYADWLEAIIPNAIVEYWPETGHYPHLTATDRFVARLAVFDATLANYGELRRALLRRCFLARGGLRLLRRALGRSLARPGLRA